MYDYSREPRYKPGVPWYWARAERGIDKLRKALDNGSAPSVLQERLGALVDLGRIKNGQHRGHHLLHIQVFRTGYAQRYIGDDDAGLDLCLAEKGIVLEQVMQNEAAVTADMINREYRRPILAQFGKLISGGEIDHSLKYVNYISWSLETIREHLLASLPTTQGGPPMASVVTPPRPPAPRPPPPPPAAAPKAPSPPPVAPPRAPAAPPPPVKAPPAPPPMAAPKAPPAPPAPPGVRPPAGPPKPVVPAPTAPPVDGLDDVWAALASISLQMKLMQVYVYMGRQYMPFVSVAEDGNWAIDLSKADAQQQADIAYTFGKDSPATLAAAIKANEELDLQNILDAGFKGGVDAGGEPASDGTPTIEEINAINDWKSFDAMAPRCGFEVAQFKDHKALKQAGLAQAKQALIESLPAVTPAPEEGTEVKPGDKVIVTYDFDGKGDKQYAGIFVQGNPDGTWIVDCSGQQYSFPIEAISLPAA